MDTKKILTLVLATAIAGPIYLAAEKLSAQAEFENPQSTDITMIAIRGSSNEQIQRTSHFGIVDPIGLLPNQQIAITLNDSVEWYYRAGDPLTPLFGYKLRWQRLNPLLRHINGLQWPNPSLQPTASHRTTQFSYD